jgi:hypothetical protein
MRLLGGKLARKGPILMLMCQCIKGCTPEGYSVVVIVDC